MTRLYDLAGEWAHLQTLAEQGEDVGDALAAIGDELEAKGAAVFAVLANLDADASAMRDEERRIAARRKAVENNRQRLRDYIRDCMDAAGVVQLRTPTGSLTVSDGPEAVEILDEAELPDEYVTETVTRKPNKAAIKAAYQQHGECVSGTRIARKRVLTVR